MSDIKEIAERLDGFGELLFAKKAINGIWLLDIKVCEVTPTAGYDLCRKLNERDKDDYFSILRVEMVGENKFTIEVKRIKNETESN